MNLRSKATRQTPFETACLACEKKAENNGFEVKFINDYFGESFVLFDVQ